MTSSMTQRMAVFACGMQATLAQNCLISTAKYVAHFVSKEQSEELAHSVSILRTSAADQERIIMVRPAPSSRIP